MANGLTRGAARRGAGGGPRVPIWPLVLLLAGSLVAGCGSSSDRSVPNPQSVVTALSATLTTRTGQQTWQAHRDEFYGAYHLEVAALERLKEIVPRDDSVPLSEDASFGSQSPAVIADLAEATHTLESLKEPFSQIKATSIWITDNEVVRVSRYLLADLAADRKPSTIRWGIDTLFDRLQYLSLSAADTDKKYA